MHDSTFVAGRAAHLQNKRAEALRRIDLDHGMPEAHREWKRNDLLPMIDAALARINDGTYGICIDCGEMISRRRLERRPEVPRCVPCQREVES